MVHWCLKLEWLAADGVNVRSSRWDLSLMSMEEAMPGYQPRFELSDQPLMERDARPKVTIPASLVMDLVSYDLGLTEETVCAEGQRADAESSTG